ncbi:MAG: MarR family transcriptional regulator [Pseudomonadota bacterium]
MSISREIRCFSRDEAICQGVTFHQFMILDAVAKTGELGLAELHRILSVEKSTTTRLVNPLIRKGLLKRDKATHDSRAANLALTEAGMETHRKVSLCLAGFFEGIARNIPEGQREGILEAVKIFTGAMRKAAVTCR